MKKKLLLTVLAMGFLLSAHWATAQIINTVAGDGSWVYNGDNQPATDAGLYSPFGVVVDDSGNFYIADAINNRVRKVNTAGIITTYAGTGYAPSAATGAYSGDGGPADSADLYWPESIAIDKAGNMYIADAGNNRIRKVNSAGIITTYAGSDSAGYAGDGGPATAARLHYPSNIALDASNNLYIADVFNNRIRKVDTSGVITTVAGNGYSNDTLFAGGYSGDGGPADSAALNWPSGVAVDRTGNLYIADMNNNCVRMVDAAGIITTIANADTIPGYNGDNIAATSALLWLPSAVLTDTLGDIYIADGANSRIREITPDGLIQTFAGGDRAGFSGDGGMATDAELLSPNGMALDAVGGMYFADQGNYVIRYISPAVNGVKNIRQAGYTVAPNPAETFFRVSFAPGIVPTVFTLYDLYGRIICTQTPAAGSATALFNVADLAPGIYILEGNTGGAVHTQEVIRQ